MHDTSGLYRAVVSPRAEGMQFAHEWNAAFNRPCSVSDARKRLCPTECGKRV